MVDHEDDAGLDSIAAAAAAAAAGKQDESHVQSIYAGAHLTLHLVEMKNEIAREDSVRARRLQVRKCVGEEAPDGIWPCLMSDLHLKYESHEADTFNVNRNERRPDPSTPTYNHSASQAQSHPHPLPSPSSSAQFSPRHRDHTERAELDGSMHDRASNASTSSASASSAPSNSDSEARSSSESSASREHRALVRSVRAHQLDKYIALQASPDVEKRITERMKNPTLRHNIDRIRKSVKEQERGVRYLRGCIVELLNSFAATCTSHDDGISSKSSSGATLIRCALSRDRLANHGNLKAPNRHKPDIVLVNQNKSQKSVASWRQIWGVFVVRKNALDDGREACMGQVVRHAH
ncbi:hypothetical protein IE81DRAFT_233041 [Ceraceosorus guamensis]|uniref:Uncharacterized protein n=1 Tax=Ceraceosorus guamensis TaxID=1522189 RepID=A0A316VRR1_9BASI|nr:hypothetical protein IE81DRAFT_233041 [Ceraceosorus guamensis]PWN40339.1 hypothetical protein IE81DRAFT_233041 [Ceraceosorus guamensis]